MRRKVNQISEEVIMRIDDALKLARVTWVTMDVWTTKGMTAAFLGVTVHMFNPVTRKRENYRVACRRFPGSHTALATADITQKVAPASCLLPPASCLLPPASYLLPLITS